MKQKIVSLVEVLTELEDLIIIPDPDATDKKDLDCALRDFARLFVALTREVMDYELKEINRKIQELKNEKI